MSTIKDSIAAIATAQGYDGPAPQTIKDGILSLADTLAGEDAGDASTIADAIDVIAPYIGSGGGGGGSTSLGNLAYIASAEDLSELDHTDSSTGDVHPLSNVSSINASFTNAVALSNQKPLAQLEMSDLICRYLSGDAPLLPDGTRVTIGTSAFWPDSATDGGSSEPEAGVVYDVDALLVTPTNVEINEYGDIYVRAYTTTAYTGVKFTRREDGIGVYEIPISGIPAPLANVASFVPSHDSTFNNGCPIPSIVIQAKWYD